MIKIVYACNDGYMDGLYLSILSILRRSKQQFEFNVLTGNFSYLKENFIPFTDQNKSKLNELIKSFNSSNTINFIDCTDLAKTYLTNKKNLEKKKFSPYACLRLLLDKINQINGKIIYLDTDVMAAGDIVELDNVDIQDNEIAVCHNWWLRHVLGKDNFNSGVMVMNLDKIRETKFLEKAVDLFNKKNFSWPDQTALKRTVSKVMYFPGDEYRFNYQKNTIQNDTVLKHFCACPYHWPKHYNIKQFQVDEVHKYLKIHTFDEDFEIWKKNLKK